MHLIKKQLSKSSCYFVLFTSCSLITYAGKLDEWALQNLYNRYHLSMHNPQNKTCWWSVAVQLLVLAVLTFLANRNLNWPSVSGAFPHLHPPPRPSKPTGCAQSSVPDSVGRFSELLASKNEWRAPAWQDELFLSYLQPQRQHMTGASPHASFS